MDLIESELSALIIGCCIRVHKSLGPGFLEKIYEEALAIEFTHSNIRFERQKMIFVSYQGQVIGDHRLDYFIEGKVVLELKACKEIEDVHLAITRSYVRATDTSLGLVINFAKPTLEIRRVANSF